MNVVLVEPEIPQNTGNIARSCLATGTRLHLVEPLGFSLDDRYLRRAGMDYWRDVDVVVHRSLPLFLESIDRAACHFLSTKGPRSYTDVSFGAEDYLVFGCESRGLPEALLVRHIDNCMRIPMREGVRSLNLSSAAAVVLFEALRQNGFPGLSGKGVLSSR